MLEKPILCPWCQTEPSIINRQTGWAMIACENQECPVKPSVGVSDGESEPEKRVLKWWNSCKS